MSAMTISEKSAVSENIDCYENLANAIVLQAVKDYKAALHTLEDYPESSFAKHEIVVQRSGPPKASAGVSCNSFSTS